MWKLGRRPALDGIRGVAILLVMLAHQHAPGLRSGGESGVTLFFTLSGFLITCLLCEELRDNGAIRLLAFYARRALRLLPALAVVIAVFSLQQFAHSWVGFPLEPLGRRNVHRDALAAAFYVANWFRVSGVTLGHLSHTWSLSIEEQFYIVWPGLLLLARGHRRILLPIALGGSVVAVVLRIVLWHGPQSINRVYFGTDTRMDALLIGCALGLWLTSGRRLPAGRIAFALGVVLLAVATTASGERFVYTVAPGLAALGGALMIAAVVTRGTGTRMLSWRPLAFTGVISYGLYLWHVPLFDQINAFGPLNAHPLLRAAIAFVIAYAIAIASYRWVEKPFLRRKNRLHARGSAQTVVAPVAG